MGGYQILLVEDDLQIGQLLKGILAAKGYNVRWSQDGADISGHVSKVDLVIMDVMLPLEDGYQLSKKIKQVSHQIPIIFLTARSDIESKLKGLEIGEDYLAKPFDPRELLVRMEKLLHYAYGEVLIIQHLKISCDRQQLFNEDGLEIFLTPTERKIFFYLYENRDCILTKEHFFEYIWPLEDRNPSILNVHMKKLRTKISDENGQIIQTIYGEGYRLNSRIRT